VILLSLAMVGGLAQTLSGEARDAVRHALAVSPAPRIVTVRPCRIAGDAHGLVYGRDQRFHKVRRWRWVYVNRAVAIETDDGYRYPIYNARCRTGRSPR
jgi:hypothetical protein